MEISEFAREILFGSTLESKLLDPGPAPAEDRRPGRGIEIPPLPGRPDSLRWGENRLRPEKPLSELRKLESETDRALLLHHFANHELLALELMALVLLRFPESPPSFRRSLVETIREEQKHLRLYRSRMNTMGLDFGDAPVNAFFWNHIATVESPLDFVVRMSMTFEQANLDYAEHYAGVFAELGDARTAAVLELVLEEEIGHVKNGVRWFHEWRDAANKDPESDESDDNSEWNAYRRLLPSPLTPARARGLGFNAGARERAGLSPEFIRELRVYSHSRGRPPAVFVFHPACEEFIARGAGAVPEENIRRLARDLDCIPMYGAAAEDVVLVHRTPSSDFLTRLKAMGIAPPEFKQVSLIDFQAGNRSKSDGRTDFGKFGERKLGDLRPWGWSPSSLNSLRPLPANVVGRVGEALRTRLDSGMSPESLRRVFSREFSRTVALDFAATPEGDFVRDQRDDAGVFANETEQALREIAEQTQRNEAVFVKSLFSSSGRGKFRVGPEEFRDDPEGVLANRLKKFIRDQGGVILEPWRRRRLDLSTQIQIEESGRVRVLGMTRMLVDAHGRYLGSAVGNLMDDLTPDEIRFLREAMQGIRRGASFAGRALFQAGYRGPAGIDSFIYHEDQDEDRTPGLRTRPLVEINPRFTMGRMALDIGRRVRSGRTGLWLLLNLKDVQGAGYADFPEFARDFERRFPVTVDKNPSPFIMSGALATTDPERAEMVLSLLLVAPDIKQCRAAISDFKRIAACI